MAHGVAYSGHYRQVVFLYKRFLRQVSRHSFEKSVLHRQAAAGIHGSCQCKLCCSICRQDLVHCLQCIPNGQLRTLTSLYYWLEIGFGVPGPVMPRVPNAHACTCVDNVNNTSLITSFTMLHPTQWTLREQIRVVCRCSHIDNI